MSNKIETEIILKNPNDLIQYDKNNKIHPQSQIDLIANSITQFGFNTPIVIDSNNIIIAGHGRALAAIKLGLQSVPCIVKTDLTEAQIRAYRIADNKITELSQWDGLALNQEMEFLQSVSFDLSSVGIDSFLISVMEAENKEIDTEEIQESTSELKIKLPTDKYYAVLEKLRDINADLSIALMTILDV